MSSVTDEQVAAELESLDLPLENMFLLPAESVGWGLIALWYPEFGLRILILEKAEVAKACYEYLLQRGARQFDSMEQILQAAATEKWPGWDTCEPYLKLRDQAESS
jgi:hypothetical protein